MPQLTVTLTMTYNVHPDNYGNTDLASMAKIDEENFRNNLDSLIELVEWNETTSLKITVKPVGT